MFQTKVLPLVLALPLLLVGCGAEPMTTNNVPTDAEPQPLEATQQIELDISNDPVEQVDALNETIEQLEDAEEEMMDDDVALEIEPETPAEPVVQVEAALEAEAVAVETPPVLDTEAETNATLNGNYSYEVSYATPPGVTPLTANFTLENDMITAVSLAGNPQHQTSIQYQKLIQDELNTLIVGQDYEMVAALPNKVAGSSLTPGGFNKALEQLQAEG